MKKLALILLVISFETLAVPSISKIKIPNTCTSATKTFEVEYYMTYGLPYTPIYDVITQVKWEFIENNNVFLTQNSKSGDFVPMGLYGEAKVKVSQLLPSGNITVRVTLTYTAFLADGTTIPNQKRSDTKTFFVGPAKPVMILGPSNICPNNNATYSIAPISNADSYTWEVPSSWSVNGISGPIVTGQSNSVSIFVPCSSYTVGGSQNSSNVTPPICNHNAPYSAVIKVKAVSEICGEGSYQTKIVSVDYPFAVSHYEASTEIVSFSVDPSGFPSYQWMLPDSWLPTSALSSSTINVQHNDQSGLLDLRVKTFCNNFYSTSYFFEPTGSDCGQPFMAYPNPVNDMLIIDPPCLNELSSIAVEESGVFHPIRIDQNAGQYRVDVSSFKPGLHILKVQDSKGKERYIRFIKSN